MASAEELPPFSNINFENEVSTTPVLGRGGHAAVYGPCYWKNSLFAFKLIDVVKSLSDSTSQRAKEWRDKLGKKSWKAWSSLDHRNLIKIRYADMSDICPPSLTIVMEYANGGTLTRALRSQSSPLPFSIVKDWAEQIATGMSYLHEKSIVHGHLKSGNILLLEPFNPESIQDMTLKITDFEQMPGSHHTAKEGHAAVAEEVFRTGFSSKARDVWSYGVVLWEILTGQAPSEIATINLKSTISCSGLGVLRKLFEGCWNEMKEKRPMFSEILTVLPDIHLDKEVIETLQAEHWTNNCERMTSEETRQLPGSVDYKMRRQQQVEEDAVVTGKLLKQSQPPIYGLAILNDEVFVSYLQSSLITVYDSTTFTCKRTLTVSGLTNPEHIVSCSVYQCLYAFDWSYQGMACEILRIDPHIGKVVKNWETREGGGRLSVANDTNIILNINQKAQLNEYTADGELLRMINLASGTDILRAWHALKLDSGLFVVCHGDYDDPRSRVCLLSIIDNSQLFQQRLDTEVLRTFGDDYGNPFNLLKRPMYLAVDKDGSILVCDAGTRRMFILNSCLEEARLLLPEENTEVLPWRVCVDESNGRYLHAEYNRIQSCKLLSDGSLDWQTVFE